MSSIHTKISGHPNLEEVKKPTLDHNGDVFSVHFRLQGRYTVDELRRLLTSNLVLPAQIDLERGAYRAVFITPDFAECTEKCEEIMYSDALKEGMFGGGNMVYGDERDHDSYGGKIIHAHKSNGCSTSVGIEDGDSTTDFFMDNNEVRDAILEESGAIVAIQDELEAEMFPNQAAKLTISQQALAACDFLFREHSRSSGNRTCIQEHQKRVQNRIIQKESAQPVVGNIAIFANDLLHTANINSISTSTNPGAIFVQHMPKLIVPNTKITSGRQLKPLWSTGRNQKTI